MNMIVDLIREEISVHKRELARLLKAETALVGAKRHYKKRKPKAEAKPKKKMKPWSKQRREKFMATIAKKKGPVSVKSAAAAA